MAVMALRGLVPSRTHEFVPIASISCDCAANLRLREWNRSCFNQTMRTPALRDLCLLKEQL
jgi:hypothetical protein